MKRRGLILFLILLCTAFLRFWKLPTIPPSLSHDEVAIGYNAWSILQTGKDEYGSSYPLLFRSFDDYKLPGYIYTTVLSEKIFGLNEFAVRLPSALFGVLTVLVLYFLIREIFAAKARSPVRFGEGLALIAAGLLAINPWHVNFSRAAFEANASLFFIVLGMFFLAKSATKPWYFLFTFVSFVVSIYFYYTARILAPALLFLYLLAFRDKIAKSKKWIALSLFLGFVLLSPFVPHMLKDGLSRINQVSIFEDKSLTNPYTDAIIRHENSFLARILYNRRVAYLQQFSDNYLKNFAPDFYFVNGTGPIGLLYLWELPFFFLGFYSILRMQTKWRWLIVGWFFTVPIVGGLTTGQPNALRTLANVPMAVLFTAVGVSKAHSFLIGRRYRKFFVLVFFALVLFFTARLITLYFDYHPRISAIIWGDGHKQMAQFVKENKDVYDTIYVTGEFWRPYIYMLFYMQYPPSLYQTNGSKEGFSNLRFGQAIWDRGEGINLSEAFLSDLVKGKTLFIFSQKDFYSQERLIGDGKRPYKLKAIKLIDGTFVKPVFYAATLQ